MDMLSRHLKLKVNKSQEKCLNQYLWHLEGLYNWAIRQIKLNAMNGIYLNSFNLNNLTRGNAKKIGISAQVFQATIKQACDAWQRYFNKVSNEPKLKSKRKRMKSFTFQQVFESGYPKGNKITLPKIGTLRFFKQEIPIGKIKTIKVLKKASGWYLVLTIDANHKISHLRETKEQVGIDTGFMTLMTLSNGIKYENPRELRRSEELLAQAQRGGNKVRIAKLQEHISNQKKDRNHKDSTDIVRNYQTIFITNDDLIGQANKFGKSVSEAKIGQLRNFIRYKGLNSGREVILVDSHKSTMTCSNCGTLTGPRGLKGLKVRSWVCSACGVEHDRDVNSAMFTLKVGLGQSLMIK